MQALHLFEKKRKLPIRAILLFCFPLFFIFLADSVMSYIFPILVADSLQSNTMLGIIMALSSILGIFCDFTFPQLLRNRSWKFQLTVGIIIAILFPVFSNLGAVFSLSFFFVIATLIWGVYYEFLQFSQQSFVTGEETPKDFSKDWGIIFLIEEITVNVGPIIGSFLLTQRAITSNLTVNFFQIVSLILALAVMMNMPTRRNGNIESQIQKTLNFFRELKYWEKLGERVWPVILSGITISFVSASYWTVGGLLGMELAGDSGYDWVVMVLFGVPLIFGSLILTKIPLTRNKKRFSQISLFVGGLLMSTLIFFKHEPILLLSVIAVSSFALSFAGPLNEAVYSDLLERSGKSKMHLLGIAKANTSLAYILAPLLTGYLADKTDYYLSLTVVGGIALVVGGVLLLSTPRKIKIPQLALKELDRDIKHSKILAS